MRKGARRDGRNPTLLTGYGGFGISQAPRFLPARRIWLDQGEIGLMRHIHQARGPLSRLMSDVLELFHHPKTGDATSSHG